MTARQRALLGFIHRYQRGNGGVSPTMTECAAAIGVRGKASVHRELDELQRAGHLRRLRGRHRAIELLRPPPVSTYRGQQLYAVPGPWNEVPA